MSDLPIQKNLKDILQEKILLEDLANHQDIEIKKLRHSNKDTASKLSHEINELKQEKILNKEAELTQTNKVSNNKNIYISCIAVIAVFVSLFLFIGADQNFEGEMNSGYVLQNLRGDTIDTWVSWQIPPEKPLYVNIVNNKHLTEERFDLIKSVIVSDEILDIDDNLMNKAPKGTISQYYLGWKEALDTIPESTKYIIPKNLQVISEQSERGGDIVIILTDLSHGDGYAGFTKSITDSVQNQILKSTITIYDIDKISKEQLLTLTRHEMGHAMGLAHSTAQEDLMHPVIETPFPYISSCDLDAIEGLYNGNQKSEVVCES